MKVVSVLASLAAVVSGHAQLNSPAAYNPAPSKAAPCGGGSARTTTQLTAGAGGQFQIDWEVIAGDGVGPVTVTVDPTGGTNFAGANAVQFTMSGANNPNKVAKFQLTANVPANMPACAEGGCTMQVKSTSNWYACASVKFQVAPTPVPPTPKPTLQPTEKAQTRNPTQLPTSVSPTSQPTPAAPTPPPCIVATGLTYCSMVNGVNVEAKDAADLADLDGLAQAASVQNLNNPDVYNKPDTPGCADAYAKLVCSKYFKKCRSFTQTCRGNCQRANELCGIDPSHTGLYNCQDDSSYLSNQDDAIGKCVGSNNPDLNSGSNNSPRVLLLSAVVASFCLFF